MEEITCCFKWKNFRDFIFEYIIRDEGNVKETYMETVRKYRIKYCPECGLSLGGKHGSR